MLKIYLVIVSFFIIILFTIFLCYNKNNKDVPLITLADRSSKDWIVLYVIWKDNILMVKRPNKALHDIPAGTMMLSTKIDRTSIDSLLEHMLLEGDSPPWLPDGPPYVMQVYNDKHEFLGFCSDKSNSVKKLIEIINNNKFEETHGIPSLDNDVVLKHIEWYRK